MLGGFFCLAGKQVTVIGMKPVKQEQGDLTCGLVGTRDRSRGHTRDGCNIRLGILGSGGEDISGEPGCPMVAFCIFMGCTINMCTDSFSNRVHSVAMACTDTGMRVGVLAIPKGMRYGVWGVICTKGAGWACHARGEAQAESMAT